eukprot:scaffold84139_cov15-Tisochrysis_lutea.AAC.1
MPSTQHMATASCGHAPPAPSTLTKSTTQGVVAVFLPRNTDLKQLESLVPQGKVWHVERNYVNGRLKGIIRQDATLTVKASRRRASFQQQGLRGGYGVEGRQ